MSIRSDYASAAAARRGITDHLRTLAGQVGWAISDLQRQYAYDRLLARLFADDPTWVIKGAVALLARQIGTRHTTDIDLYRQGLLRDAEQALRAGAARDLGDWLTFTVGPPTATVGTGTRLAITCTIGPSVWAQFHIDLVTDVQMTGDPDPVPPLVDDTGQRFLAYPLVDHLADKLAATLERYGPDRRSSTRYKDLVDLVVLLDAVSVDAASAGRAWRSELDRRGLAAPATWSVPADADWARGYAAEARRAIGLRPPALDEAVSRVRAYVDPLTAGTAAGVWDPARVRWSGAG